MQLYFSVFFPQPQLVLAVATLFLIIVNYDIWWCFYHALFLNLKFASLLHILFLTLRQKHTFITLSQSLSLYWYSHTYTVIPLKKKKSLWRYSMICMALNNCLTMVFIWYFKVQIKPRYSITIMVQKMWW